MNLDFSGKTAIVTGGTRGIGRSITELFLASGARVIYTGTKKTPDQPLQGGQYAELNLDDWKSIRRFIEEILNPLTKLHILINNAGINIIEPIDEIRDEDWDKVIQVNLTSAMMLMRAASAHMKARKVSGRIVNISSIFGLVSKEKRAIYSASKSGLIGLTRAAALDLAPHDILVNAVCPGVTMTELTKTILSDPAAFQELTSKIPMKRCAEPEEIAPAVVFLCSEANNYITGQTIVVDGGFTAH